MTTPAVTPINKNDNLNDSSMSEDAIDEDRIELVRELIYQTYKVPNREGMKTENLIKHINALYPDSDINKGVFRDNVTEKSEIQHRSLYNTLLGL